MSVKSGTGALAALLAICVSSTGCGRESTAPPALTLPLTDRIAIATAGDIVIVKSDGTDRRYLTGPGTVDICPMLSPDGNWIAYLQKPTANSVLAPFTMVLARADGTNRRELALTRTYLYQCPVWARDSRLVAFRSPSEDVCSGQDNVVLTYDTSGSLRSQLSIGEARYLRFSPDDSQILFVDFSAVPVCHGYYDSRLVLTRLDGNGGKRVVGAGFGDWSPAGRDIAFSTCGILCADPLPPNPCVAICITSDTGATWRSLIDYGNQPVYSPDGSAIAFACAGDLCLVPSQGGTVTRFTVGDAGPQLITWSPDGGTIGFLCGPDVCLADVRTKLITDLKNTPVDDLSFSLSPASPH